jgi:L-lysine exporter family protein LysE/ArgO
VLFLPVLKGFVLSLSLIVAIGPQNALLLRQAVRREQAWLAASLFSFGDIVMISLGGFGIGHFLEGWPLLKFLLTAFGAFYIFWFGFGVFRQLFHPKALTIHAPPAQKSILFAALAVTFLNPHAILDTVVVMGTIALQFQGMAKYTFMSGAILGSVFWFFGVAWAGQRLAPFLSRPQVWRVIESIIVIVMLSVAMMLAADAWRQAQTLFRGS